jgi:hypothetical protein
MARPSRTADQAQLERAQQSHSVTDLAASRQFLMTATRQFRWPPTSGERETIAEEGLLIAR